MYEEPSLYLRPPTLEELIYVVAVANRNTSNASFNYVNHLKQQPKLKELITKPFLLPKEVTSRSAQRSTNSPLRWEQFCIIEKLGPIPRYEDQEYLSALHQELSPETTLERGFSDCKGLSLLAVALSREYNEPARLICPERHMITQIRKSGGWNPVDPSLPYPFCYSLAPREIEPPARFDEYYERILAGF